ncbi:MAG: CpaB family protein [Planctomycetota bacterium]|jgi:Flp pilus assembly protein CpaB
MAARRTAKHGSGGLGTALLVVVCVLLASLTGVGLWAAGVFGPAEAAPTSREGQIACPALARDVPTYSKVTRADLLNPRTGQLNVVWLPQAASDAALRDVSQIMGRVVSRDKSSGSVLTEADFFPKGTRPGIAAGVPLGKVAMSVPVEKIAGLNLLQRKDTFDIVASLPAQDRQSDSNIEYAVLLGGIKPPDTRAGQLARQTGVRTLVQRGTMVALTRGTKTSTTGAAGLSGLVGGKATKTTTTTQVTIAVAPEEVTPLTEALGLESLSLFCVTHTSQPDTDGTDPAPEFSTEGLVAVPAPVRKVAAYSAISQHDLADPVTGRLNVYYFEPDRISDDWILDFQQLEHRVVARAVEPGRPLAEADLFPVGTLPGPTAGAPPGTVVLNVPADRIDGLATLTEGDRFTLQARLSGDIRPAFPQLEWATVQGGRLDPDDERTQQQLRSGIRTVVESAVVIQSSYVEQSSGAPNEAGDEAQDSSVISIAVPEALALAVTQMLNREDKLFAVGHSSQPEEQRIGVPLDTAEFPSRGDKEATVKLVNWQPETDRVDGWVAVPVTARDVKPFERLTVEDFVDPATGRLRVFYFPPEKVDEAWVRDLSELLDRVVSEPLDSGRVVNREALLPEGTRPGVSAGIPPGWTAVRLTSLQVRGLGMANELDHIELVATRPIRAEHAQAKAEWPAIRSDAVFTVPDSEDVFTQADVRVLATDAIVLTRAVEDVEVAVVDEEETALDEAEVGESVNRKSIVRKKTPRYVTRSAVVCSVAVPAEVVTALTEALTIQSIVGDGAGNDGAAGSDGAADGDDTSQSGAGGQRTDNEVAIFAVVRSSNPEAAANDDQIPGRDVIQNWLKDWSSRFIQHRATERMTPTDTTRVQRIRGATVEDQYRFLGRDITPQESSVQQRDRVTEEVLRSDAP